ncbi:MAG: hypothetical protein QM758_09070 [Armatimonas sp.]
MTEDEKKASENRSELTARGAMVSAGIVTAAAGHPVEGALLVGAAESVANAAKGLYQSPTMQKLQEFVGSVPAWRISKTFRRVEKRIIEEGIDVNPERMADLFEVAIPFVGNAKTEEKRRMMEEVIINGARRSTDAAAQVEAAEALALISDMPDSVALVFATIIAKIRQQKLNDWTIVSFPFPTCDLSLHIIIDVYNYLQRQQSGYAKDSWRLGLIEKIKVTDDGIKADVILVSPNEREKYQITHVGKWLGEWITNNPTTLAKDSE